MKKILCLLAAFSLTIVSTATAGGEGRTVCVMRARPCAIQPVQRTPVTFEGNVMSPTFRPAATASGVGPFPSYLPNTVLGLRIPVIYGQHSPRLHYVSPVLRNGYVGGMQNLMTPYVNIPPNFTRVPTLRRVSHYGGTHWGGNGRPGGGQMGGPGRPGGGQMGGPGRPGGGQMGGHWGGMGGGGRPGGGGPMGGHGGGGKGK